MAFAWSKRNLVILVVILAVSAAAAALVLIGRNRHGATALPLDAIPRDSFLVGTVNVAELRRSPLYDVLVGKDGPLLRPQNAVLDRRALGLKKLSDACGFDPLLRVESLAVGVPEEGDKGEFGVAARVTVTSDELTNCTTNLAKERGGKVATKDVGSFSVAYDENATGPAQPQLAYGSDSLLVVGRGVWFDAMLATADGKQPGARTAPAHAAMRASLLAKDGWSAPTVLVSALLPRSLRTRLKDEMAATLAGEKAPDESHAIMDGVLSVSSAGLAVKAGAAGGAIDAAVELVCDTAEACTAVDKLLQKKRFEWGKELSLRMVGLGPLLDSIEIKTEGTRIRVTAGAAADNLASTIDRVLRFRARSTAK